MTVNKYRDFIASVKDSDAYWIETPVLEFTEQLSSLMKENDLSRADLARQVNCKAPYITKILRGNVNFTLRTMAKLAKVFGYVVHIHLKPAESFASERDDSSSNVVSRAQNDARVVYVDFEFRSEGHNGTESQVRAAI